MNETRQCGGDNVKGKFLQNKNKAANLCGSQC